MDGKKENKIRSLVEALPGMLIGFSLGNGMMALFIMSFLDRHYPYESFVFLILYTIDRVLFVFMTAFVVIKLFWLRQKKPYLKMLFLMILFGAGFGYIVALIVSYLGRFDFVNAIWGI